MEVFRHTDKHKPQTGSSPESAEAPPFSTVQEVGGRLLIHRASGAATAVGISPGMTMTAALTLCPTLKIRNRDIGLEHSRLRELAGRASRFTPMVSREPPGSLLLEVSGSLRLFGGLHQLRTLLRADFSLRGHRSCIAVTPAPAASLLLAANEYSVLISRREALRSALGPLSVADLSLPHNTLTRLGHAGVRTLRDLWRLPSDGLALRFGPELTHYMNRLTGMSPEPRYNSTPSGKLVSTLELPAGTVETGYLLPVMGRLLNELGDWLRIRDAGTRSVRFFLYHPHRPATTISVGTRLVTRDTSRLLHLLDEHLNPVRLPEPVTRLTLAAGTPEPYAPECRNLFPGRHDFHAPVGQENEWAQVLDQLVARLGTEALHRPASPLDHRPSAENHEIGRESTERPVWILPTAQPLSCHHGTPRLGGRLSLAGTPERIETGWWDGRGVCRDYHVATDPQGGRLWVYRNADTPEKWHLQGYFS